MAYNPALYYPQNYQPVVQQYAYPQAVQAQPPAARAIEVIPVDTEDQVNSWQVQAGTTVEFMARNDAFVAFKTVGINGEPSIEFYDRRPPAPPAPVFDPGAYVTKAELEKRLEAVLAATGAKAEEAEE